MKSIRAVLTSRAFSPYYLVVHGQNLPAARSTFASPRPFPYNPFSFSGLRMRYPVGFRPPFLLWATVRTACGSGRLIQGLRVIDRVEPPATAGGSDKQHGSGVGL